MIFAKILSYFIVTITLILISGCTNIKSQKSISDPNILDGEKPNMTQNETVTTATTIKPELINFADNKAGKVFEGELYIPKIKQAAKYPLIIIVHEWWGKNNYVQGRGQQLASMGYATLVVDLYGNNAESDNPTGAMALAKPFYEDPSKSTQLLEKYYQLVIKDNRIDKNQISAIGYCFGGTQVLNWARSGKSIKLMASFHGGLQGDSKNSHLIRTPIYVFNGEADQMVKNEDIEEFKKEFSAKKANLKFINYPGALHAFSNPQATEVGKKFNLPVAYNAAADKGSFNELLKALR